MCEKTFFVIRGLDSCGSDTDYLCEALPNERLGGTISVIQNPGAYGVRHLFVI